MVSNSISWEKWFNCPTCLLVSSPIVMKRAIRACLMSKFAFLISFFRSASSTPRTSSYFFVVRNRFPCALVMPGRITSSMQSIAYSKLEHRVIHCGHWRTLCAAFLDVNSSLKIPPDACWACGNSVYPVQRIVLHARTKLVPILLLDAAPVSHLRMLSNTAIGCSAQTIRSGLVRIALVWESRRFARERFCPVYFRVFPEACFSIHLRLIFPIELCLFSCLVESDFHWAHSLLAGERRGRLIERLIFIIYREWWFYLAMFVSELHHVLLNKLWNLESNFYKR